MSPFIPRLAFAFAITGFSLLSGAAATAQTVPADLVIKNATVMTASHGTIQHGSVWLHNGKIAGVGATVSAPAGATVVDATGKYVTPGIIDPHSHSALGDDVNEATSPVTPSMMMIDAFDNRDKALYQALAGGVTSELLLHGSANMIGGQAVVIKNKFGLLKEGKRFPNGAGVNKVGSQGVGRLQREGVEGRQGCEGAASRPEAGGTGGYSAGQADGADSLLPG